MRTRVLGIIALAAAVGACGSKPSPTSPSSTGGTTHTVTIVLGAYSGGNGFSPSSLSIKVGDTVTWQNNDSVVHTATATDGTFDSGQIAPNGNYSFKFTKAGTVNYTCTIHGFAAAVTVQ